MAEVEGEPVATRKCDVCEKQIEVPKFRLHEVACARQNFKCRKCGEVVAKAEREAHDEDCGKPKKAPEPVPVAAPVQNRIVER